MATVFIRKTSLDISVGGPILPMGSPVAENIVDPTTSQISEVTFEPRTQALIKVSGGIVHARFGTEVELEAVATEGWPILDGEPMIFRNTTDKVMRLAVIDA